MHHFSFLSFIHFIIPHLYCRCHISFRLGFAALLSLWFTFEMCPNFNVSESKQVTYHRRAAFHFNGRHARDYDTTLSALCGTQILISMSSLKSCSSCVFHRYPVSSKIRQVSVLLLRQQQKKENGG